MLVSPVLQAYAGYASACDNFLQPARKLSQVLVSLVLQVSRVYAGACVTRATCLCRFRRYLRKVRLLLFKWSCWDKSGSCWDKWGHVGTSDALA